MLFSALLEEYKSETQLYKFQKLYKLANLIYIELLRSYLPGKIESRNHNYLTKIRELQELVEINFRELKTAKDYAALMNVSDKHLNRMSNEILNKTVSDLITGRIMLEAKRMLAYSTYTANEIAADLGYADTSYFFRVFKKVFGYTPIEFMKKFREGIL